VAAFRNEFSWSKTRDETFKTWPKKYWFAFHGSGMDGSIALPQTEMLGLFGFSCPNAADVPEERVKNCGVVEIKISQMTGRRERERKRTYWPYVFPS
jgi:hypothetical protein